jgi:hypothetical protein
VSARHYGIHDAAAARRREAQREIILEFRRKRRAIWRAFVLEYSLTLAAAGFIAWVLMR